MSGVLCCRSWKDRRLMFLCSQRNMDTQGPLAGAGCLIITVPGPLADWRAYCSLTVESGAKTTTSSSNSNGRTYTRWRVVQNEQIKGQLISHCVSNSTHPSKQQPDAFSKVLPSAFTMFTNLHEVLISFVFRKCAVFVFFFLEGDLSSHGQLI